MDSSQKRNRDRRQREKKQEKERRRKERAANKAVARTDIAPDSDIGGEAPRALGSSAASHQGGVLP